MAGMPAGTRSVSPTEAVEGTGQVEDLRKNHGPVRLAVVPRGRPLKLVDANASSAARLGAEIRGTRVAQT